jgi:Cd2+/Zn2+-exporting ATPase
MRQTEFYIAKMDCPTEEQMIRGRLKGMAGVERLDFDLMARTLTVVHELPDDAPIQKALASIGMEPKLLEAAGNSEEPSEHEAAPDRRAWAVIGVSGALAIAAEVVAWRTGRESSAVVIALAVASMLLGGRDTFRKGWYALRSLTLNINFLMSVAVLGAVAIGQWPEAAMVTFLFAVAEMIEGYSLDRARNAIRSLMELTPPQATVWDAAAGEWREADAAEVEVGQRVRVRPGERVPLDGTVVEGHSAVNQAPITGESLPVEKGAGDPVFAGTVNESGALVFEVTANRGNTTLDRIVRSVQEAQASRAPTQRFVDDFARYYTPAVVVFAVLVAAVPPLLFGAPFMTWLYRALVLLVIACPCALVISTPVTVVSGLAAAARLGILVKGGAYLEEGRRLRAVALDKTGTLTHGRPAVTDVVALGGWPEAEVLRVAASLDALSEHPVATAIVAAAPKATELLPVTGFQALAGRGVTGVVGGQRYFLGNRRLAGEGGAMTPRVAEVLEGLERQGRTAVVLATDGATPQPLGVIAVADTVRETSTTAVRELHDLGVRTVMLTGDNPTTARAIAEQVGVDDVRANLLPQDKLAAVEALRREHGTVGMVGDGINDAPALAKASVGFAMGAAGTDTALEAADVALMQDDLRKLPLFVRLARETARILAQNIFIGVAIKVVFFGLALTGKATLWMAVFADMGGSLLVVFNGLRLLRFRMGR